MISIKIKTEHEHQNLKENGFHERILDLQKRVFESLFEGLQCDCIAHRDFENIITAQPTEKQLFKIEKICCSDFESKIKEAVL